MADDQDSAAPRDDGSPLTRPGFLVAAVLVLVIVMLGAFLAVRVARSDNTTPTPPPATSTVPQNSPTAATSTPADSGASVCGLPEGTKASLTSAPAVTWDYQGTIAYPQSPEFGPGKVAPEGYRYCYQQGAAGALVMAANAFAQGSDPQVGDQWVQYALGDGQYREQLLSRLGTSRGSEGTRVKMAGFRILNYDGQRARVDIGVQASSQNQTLTASSVYELVWQDGDWKINADVERPLDVATIPDLAGYIPWGE